MFCSKCGKAVKNGEKFCSYCGAKIGNSAKGIYLQREEPISHEFREVYGGLNMLSDCKIQYFASIVLLILSMFLITGKMFEVSYELLYAHSEAFTLFEGHNALKILLLFGYCAAVLLMVLPLLRSRDWEKINFFLGKCMPILAIIIFAIVSVSVLRGTEKYLGSDELLGLMKAVNISVNLTENAWLFLLTSSVAEVMVFRVSDALCRQK